MTHLFLCMCMLLSLVFRYVQVQNKRNEIVYMQTCYAFLPPANVVCEGYVFTRVCHSVHSGGMHAFLGGHAFFFSGGACFFRGVHAFFQGGGGCACFFWGGACVLFFSGGRACFFQGACIVFPGGGHACFFLGDTVNERAVRILLECILVLGAC